MDPTSPAEPRAARRRMPAWLRVTLRVGATVGLMAYVIWGIWPKDEASRAEFSHMLRTADWRWWAAGLALGVVVQVAAGVRWSSLARPLGFDFPRRTFVWRFFEGSFFSLCLPSSIGGDAVKAYRIGDTTPRRLLAGCSVVADRLTGLAALGVLVAAARVAHHRGLALPATLAFGTVLALAALATMWLAMASLDRIVDMLPGPHPARQFVAQLLPYQQRPSLLAWAVAWSFVVQVGGTLATALMARTVQVDIGLGAWLAVAPLVALIETIPITIGGFGVREKAMQFFLQEYGVAERSAVFVALLGGLAKIVTGLLGGVLFMLDRQPGPAVADDGE